MKLFGSKLLGTLLSYCGTSWPARTHSTQHSSEQHAAEAATALQQKLIHSTAIQSKPPTQVQPASRCGMNSQPSLCNSGNATLEQLVGDHILRYFGPLCTEICSLHSSADYFVAVVRVSLGLSIMRIRLSISLLPSCAFFQDKDSGTFPTKYIQNYVVVSFY